MSNTKFEKRVIGAVLIKAIASNYNADFTGSPRTLPNGIVYATDKVLKYSIRNYLKEDKNNIIFYTTRPKKENMQPLDIDETFIELFGEYPKRKEIKKEKKEKEEKYSIRIKEEVDKFVKNNKGYSVDLSINNNFLLKKEIENKISYLIIGKSPDDIKRIPILRNLLKSIDIRLFGATFASKEGNISIHGPVQITHGINIFEDNNVFAEDITSSFRNSNEKSEDSMQTTKGVQTILEEGHYLHDLTINPRNIEELVQLIGNKGYLTTEDIEKFKNAINNGASNYNSASKAGVKNEFSIFITLKEGKNIQLPSFLSLIKIEKINDLKRKIDLSLITELIEDIKDEVEKVEIFIDKYSLEYDNIIFDIPNVCVKSFQNKELKKYQEKE